MLHKFILEPYKGIKSRYNCPCCQHREKTFSLYIDTETGQHINSKAGRCNRETSCGYHYTPKQYFKENNISFDKPLQKSSVRTFQTFPAKKEPSLIPFNAFNGSLTNYAENNFLNYLIELFGIDITNSLISKYYIGTSKYQFTRKDFPNYKSEKGATVFWQIDIENNIRTGKIMLYSPNTGKRIKEPFNHFHWAHKALKLPEYNLQQCFFGEHLLIDKTKPVAIVESEKSAIISSVYFPQFIWLATGGISNLNIEKCSVLQGRHVILFPDVNAYEKWLILADRLKEKIRVVVSDLLEKNASFEDKDNGLDIADYLIKMNLNDFRITNSVNTNKDVQERKPNVEVSPITNNSINNKQRVIKESWSLEIDKLECYFNGLQIYRPIRINQCTVIYDVPEFIRSHISVLRNYNGNYYYLPFLERLITLKKFIKNNYV